MKLSVDISYPTPFFVGSSYNVDVHSHNHYPLSLDVFKKPMNIKLDPRPIIENNWEDLTDSSNFDYSFSTPISFYLKLGFEFTRNLKSDIKAGYEVSLRWSLEFETESSIDSLYLKRYFNAVWFSRS